MDQIEIKGLRVMTIVGALPHEREAAQPVLIDLSLTVDLRQAGRTDSLAATVDYAAVSERVADAARAARDVLLERLAERLAAVALGFDRVAAVEVALAKLRPALAEDLASTAVRIRRWQGEAAPESPAAHEAVVALGSNLGDRAAQLRLALRRLGGVKRQSQVFETDPVGGPAGQGPYFNMVAMVETVLEPFAFLRRLHEIEAQAGRRRIERDAPRTLDLDLLFYDDLSIQGPGITVPHPRLAERRFVLAPLAEVNPERCPVGWEERLPPGGVRARGRLAELEG